jgi:hypothetical protein
MVLVNGKYVKKLVTDPEEVSKMSRSTSIESEPVRTQSVEPVKEPKRIGRLPGSKMVTVEENGRMVRKLIGPDEQPEQKETSTGPESVRTQSVEPAQKRIGRLPGSKMVMVEENGRMVRKLIGPDEQQSKETSIESEPVRTQSVEPVQEQKRKGRIPGSRMFIVEENGMRLRKLLGPDQQPKEPSAGPEKSQTSTSATSSSNKPKKKGLGSKIKIVNGVKKLVKIGSSKKMSENGKMYKKFLKKKIGRPRLIQNL